MIKWTYLVSLIALVVVYSKSLYSQEPFLPTLCNESNYIFQGIVEGGLILWESDPMEIGLVIKIEDFIKRKEDTLDIPRVMYVHSQYHFPDIGWTLTRIANDRKYIFFSRSISNQSREVNIRSSTSSSKADRRNVTVFECLLMDHWIEGVKYSKELEYRIRNIVEGTKNNEKSDKHKFFRSLDSLAKNSEAYIDLGEVNGIIETNQTDYPYIAKVRIDGDPKNKDVKAIRAEEEVKVYLKNLECISRDVLQEGRTYSFFLRKEAGRYVLSDKYFGIIENKIWDWKNL